MRCQSVEVARLLGREQELIDELYRQIDRLLDARPMGPSGPVVPLSEHEATVAKLNAAIAKRNTEIESLRKQASR